jgi:hypothetical protein
MITLIRLGAALSLSILMGPVQAGKPLPYDATLSEIAAMPEYCQARLGPKNDEKYQQWNHRIGPDKFEHIHHYCHGLKFLSRYRATFERQQRRSYLQQAISEFDYVLKRWPDSFALKADAKTRKAEAESLLRILGP